MVEAKIKKNAISNDLIKKYKEAGQEHIFKWINDLTDDEKEVFAYQLEKLDMEKLLKDYSMAKGKAANTKKLDIIPPSNDKVIIPNDLAKQQYWKQGIDSIREGKVAIVTLAGGQGTRLGSASPKGCYDIGLFSKNSLFSLQALRIRKLMMMTQEATIPWYIMTSEATHLETVDFFQSKNYFGVPAENVRFFKQAMLPAVTEEGKLIMSGKGSLALSPNGNGGIYEALDKNGILNDMKGRGIEYVHMYCVDNALVRVGDPFFIGACITAGADCAAKTVEKSDPSESVGVFCQRKEDGKMIVAEYSELDNEVARQQKESKLLFNQANIANHFFTVDFLCNLASSVNLPYHLAHKKIPTIDDEGQKSVKPVMGYKLEAFIFDVFEHGINPIIYQSSRNEEFAPLKNAPGSPTDSPEYCRKMLYNLHASWLKSNGVIMEELDNVIEVEISPLISYAGEGLEFLKDKAISSPLILSGLE